MPVVALLGSKGDEIGNCSSQALACVPGFSLRIRALFPGVFSPQPLWYNHSQGPGPNSSPPGTLEHQRGHVAGAERATVSYLGKGSEHNGQGGSWSHRDLTVVVSLLDLLQMSQDTLRACESRIEAF